MAKKDNDFDAKLRQLNSEKAEKPLSAELSKLVKNATPENIELTDEEKLLIAAEAAAEVAQDLKAEKIKEYKAAEKQKLKKQTLFQYGKDEEGEDTEYVLVMLASHMPCIMLDGKKYYSGRGYRLGVKTAAVIKEQMFRGDLHEHEISGKNTKAFYGHRPQGVVLNPSSNTEH